LSISLQLFQRVDEQFKSILSSSANKNNLLRYVQENNSDISCIVYTKKIATQAIVFVAESLGNLGHSVGSTMNGDGNNIFQDFLSDALSTLLNLFFHVLNASFLELIPQNTAIGQHDCMEHIEGLVCDESVFSRSDTNKLLSWPLRYLLPIIVNAISSIISLSSTKNDIRAIFEDAFTMPLSNIMLKDTMLGVESMPSSNESFLVQCINILDKHPFVWSFMSLCCSDIGNELCNSQSVNQCTDDDFDMLMKPLLVFLDISVKLGLRTVVLSRFKQSWQPLRKVHDNFKTAG
jgi:hypothetical protein